MRISEQLVKLLIDNHKKTSGSCGLTIVQLQSELNVGNGEIRTILNQLFIQKKIIIKEGINHKLIYINEKKNKLQ